MKTHKPIPFSQHWQQEYKAITKALWSFNKNNVSSFPPEILPLIEKYQPEKWLAVYGTLAPGKSNHHLLAYVKGTWHEGKVKGSYAADGWGFTGGYPGFIWKPMNLHNFVKVHLLESEEITQHWSMLDNFEGNAYKRIIVPVILETGSIQLSNIYALRDYRLHS